ncbi:hypothetical protein ACWOET_02075 [Enterococcus caccae]|nr:hypothetical protein RU98_GL000078 [Enterococcus caccae]
MSKIQQMLHSILIDTKETVIKKEPVILMSRFPKVQFFATT